MLAKIKETEDRNKIFSGALETIKWQSRFEKEPNKNCRTKKYNKWNLELNGGSNSRLEEIISELDAETVQINEETKQ